MNIEVHQPRLEALIQQRLASGKFADVEDVLIQALESAPGISQDPGELHLTGAELVKVMQAMPYREDVEFEHFRPDFPLRDVEL